MIEFVSEPLTPRRATFDTAAMARGEPGLPTGFAWRGEWFDVVECLERGKQSGPEVGRLDGERYLRRHTYRLRMTDGAIWSVYFTRHTPRRGPRAKRWFLHSIERVDAPER